MTTIGIIGLGYVGLPVAYEFAKHFQTIGFDTSKERVQALQEHRDETGALTRQQLINIGPMLEITHHEKALEQVDFYIITVPTPIDNQYQPDLRHLKDACVTVGATYNEGDIVVFESTVAPGTTEDVCVPIIEAACDDTPVRFGYSPERINPGDDEHPFSTVTKIVAGCDDPTTTLIYRVYREVIEAGVYVVPSVRVAEAAKLIENIQRDVNIALINELSAYFQAAGIDTHQVIAAAATKWNFLPFTPGLVGGHCIAVDPYYLIHAAEQLGAATPLIKTARFANNRMVSAVAAPIVRMDPIAKTVGIVGLTYKENVPDCRNSLVLKIAEAIQAVNNARLVLYDPYLDSDTIQIDGQPVPLMDSEALLDVEVLIFAVPHTNLDGVVKAVIRDSPTLRMVFDVKGVLDPKDMPTQVEYRRL